MSDAFEFHESRDAYVLEGPGDDSRYRIVVSRAFVDDEIGEAADDAARRAWLKANLPSILGAYTARIEGGWVKSPWDRVLVEEVEG
ncbi:hypothetical protein K1T73_17050 [Roseovarius sp. SCSIO 43702]|uniref:hypothetical protein n=1 Tax=Roseovarius sp. SCSIO 43702 TaxID=2823043 RepID=UPI001C732471|nr:hypothetical protein [Roseovarius sp. SCSIO 43702]QYX56717.1 hypothetical protein K1T73_17050 [Roseovarius sp. SCSIO 43702]